MRSTGEVLGIAPDFGDAYCKAEEATKSELPLEGTVLISVSDRDKIDLLDVAKAFSDLDFKILATGKTYQIDLIINTPAGKDSVNDDSYIRKGAIKNRIPYITTMAAAKASAEGIKAARSGQIGVKALQDFHAEIK